MRIITSNKFYADHQSKWLSKDPPEWFKDKTPDYKNNPTGGSSRFCTSFIELFDNSLVLKLPADTEISYDTYDEGEIDYCLNFRCADYLNGFMNFTGHDLYEGIGNFYGQKYLSIKLHLDVLMVSDKVESVIFLPPEYHEQASMINAQVGIYETIPNAGLHCITNMKVDKKFVEENPHIFLKKGTPLAYLYFPNGAPEKVEYVSRDEFESLRWTQTEFKAEYFRTLRQSKKEQESKCPFHKENS